MVGAIVGDIVGSVHEGRGTKTKDFPILVPRSRPTDDSILTIAVADVLLHGGSYAEAFVAYYEAYPWGGYGSGFAQWADARGREPYQSYGNGSAMRVSPVAWARDTLDDVLAEAQRSAEVTHNHPEGIRGAQAVAAAVFMARTGSDKPGMKRYISKTFGYDLDRDLSTIRPRYNFDISCQGSVPESLIAFLEASDYEDALRNAISLGGDADTMACIAGAVAEAFYGGVPQDLMEDAVSRVPDGLRNVLDEFTARYCG